MHVFPWLLSILSAFSLQLLDPLKGKSGAGFLIAPVTKHRQHAGVLSAQGPSRDETVPTGVDGRPGTCAEKRDSWMRKERKQERERQKGKDKR